MIMADGTPKHPYHLVDPSPWPALGALGALMLALGAGLGMHPEMLGAGVASVVKAVQWWIIAPGLAGVFGVFFLRQFFLSLPRELEEAAYVDGATTFQTFFRVVLPLSGGALATLGVITFLTSWNDFLWPLLMTGAVREMQTLPVGLATLQGQYTFDYGKLMAGALVLSVPVLLLYVLAQRYIIRSVATTGLKG